MDYKRLIAQLIKVDGVTEDEIYDLIALPKDSAMGDYCLPCFKFASIFRTSPINIANNIASSVELPGFLSKVEAVAGYVKFTLNKTEFAERVLKRIASEGADYGK